MVYCQHFCLMLPQVTFFMGQFEGESLQKKPPFRIRVKGKHTKIKF
jgi:hypothetical protein